MRRQIFVALAAAAVARAAAAQGAERPDPAAPQAKAPALQYRSAFAGYRPFVEERVAPWRETNESVKAGEGHGAHSPQAPAQAKPATGAGKEGPR